MNQTTMTKLINWCGLAIALVLLTLVGLHIYKKHFLLTDETTEYLFNDLPTQSAEAVKGDIPAIVNAHIMGEVPVVAAPVKQVVKVAPPPPPKPAPPKTKLDIVLTGIIDGTTPETGFAMIEIKRGKTAVIGVGEEIGKTGAILHQVLPGEVLVDRDGTIESVKMKRTTLELAMQLPDESLINLLDDQSTDTTSSLASVGQATTNAVSTNQTAAVNAAQTQVQSNNTQVQQATNAASQRRKAQAKLLASKRANAQALNNAASSKPKIMSELPIPKKLLDL